MLNRTKVLEQLAAHAPELNALGARWLSLFGSFARDEATTDSDVDLLVDLDQHTFDRYMDLKLRLEDLLGRRVDLVLVEKLKPRVRERILREEVRQRAAEIDWRKIAGMRDVLAHTYFQVDLDIVWDAAINKVPGLLEPLRCLLADLEPE